MRTTKRTLELHLEDLRVELAQAVSYQIVIQYCRMITITELGHPGVTNLVSGGRTHKAVNYRYEFDENEQLTGIEIEYTPKGQDQINLKIRPTPQIRLLYEEFMKASYLYNECVRPVTLTHEAMLINDNWGESV